MRTDQRGLEVTGASDGAIAAMDFYADAAVALKPGMDAIVAAADAIPECAMLQAYAASLYVYSQSSGAARGAIPYLARARERMSDLTEHEREFIEAVDAGCRGDFERAIGRFERIAERWPRDIMAAKIAEFHFFETGQAARQLRFMEKIAPHNRDSCHVQAMYAFALELNGLRDRAEQAALGALAIDPLTMWAQHCLAHVWAGQARVIHGIAEMERFAPSWNGFSQYVQSHNGFHLATLYLAELQFDRVLDLYRRNIWGFQPDAVVEHTDAILLLWYVELAGGDAGARWGEIAPRIRRLAHEQVFPFLSAIYLYALERVGESGEVDRAMAEIERHAAQQTGSYARVWQEIGLAEVRGSVAYARGDYERAAAMFAPILKDIALGGGSDEQRGVFAQSHFMSLIKTGHKSEASAAIDAYAAGRPATKLENRWRAQSGA